MRAATASAWACPSGARCSPRPFRQDLARRGRHTVAHEEHHGRTGVSDLVAADFLARREEPVAPRMRSRGEVVVRGVGTGNIVVLRRRPRPGAGRRGAPLGSTGALSEQQCPRCAGPADRGLPGMPELVTWREEVAATKRASFAGEQYWAGRCPGSAIRAHAWSSWAWHRPRTAPTARACLHRRPLR